MLLGISKHCVKPDIKMAADCLGCCSLISLDYVFIKKFTQKVFTVESQEFGHHSRASILLEMSSMGPALASFCIKAQTQYLGSLKQLN